MNCKNSLTVTVSLELGNLDDYKATPTRLGQKAMLLLLLLDDYSMWSNKVQDRYSHRSVFERKIRGQCKSHLQKTKMVSSGFVLLRPCHLHIVKEKQVTSVWSNMLIIRSFFLLKKTRFLALQKQQQDLRRFMRINSKVQSPNMNYN